MQKLCPKCETNMLRVDCEEINIYVSFNNQWRGLAYTCPTCHTVINIEMDPIALKHDIVMEIKKLLHR